MKILQINSSARIEGSNSTKVADAIVARLKEKNPSASVEIRDLATHPHPILDAASLGAIFTPADKRTPEQAARAAKDDAVVAQLLSSDIIVLGVPMYNFGVSVQLKSWIDAISKVGVTFRYTEKGPVGLVSGKKVYVALARGGFYRDTPADSQVPYLKSVLAFLGITDVEFVYAEGLNISPESAVKSLAGANEQIVKLIA